MKKILSSIILVTSYNLISSEVLPQQLKKCTISQAKKDRLGSELLAVVKDAKLFEKERLLEVQRLLGQGADPNSKDKWGQTPLHWAQSLDIVNALLQAGADPNSKDNEHNVPLYCAQSLDIVHALLQAGADPNSKDNWGYTPLHFAQSSDIVHALLQVGVDPNSKNKWNRTPFSHHILLERFNGARAILQDGFLYGGYSLQEVQDNINENPRLELSVLQLQDYVSEQYTGLLQRQAVAIKQFIQYLVQHRLITTDIDTMQSYKEINQAKICTDKAYKKHCKNLKRFPTRQDLDTLGIVQDFVPSLQQLCVRFIVQKAK